MSGSHYTLLIIILAFAINIQPSQATNNCNINLFGYDQTNWYNASYGFLSGLYTTIPTNCPRCDSFAKNMQGINKGYVYVIQMRDLWIDRNKVFNQGAVQILSSLVTIYAMFYDFYIHLDNLFQDTTVMTIPNIVVTMLADVAYQPTVKQNFSQKMNAISTLAMTIPGANCRALGYRVATILRFIFGVTYPN
eukprot:403367807